MAGPSMPGGKWYTWLILSVLLWVEKRPIISISILLSITFLIAFGLTKLGLSFIGW
jgi:hypothetical protein